MGTKEKNINNHIHLSIFLRFHVVPIVPGPNVRLVCGEQFYTTVNYVSLLVEQRKTRSQLNDLAAQVSDLRCMMRLVLDNLKGKGGEAEDKQLDWP